MSYVYICSVVCVCIYIYIYIYDFMKRFSFRRHKTGAVQWAIVTVLKCQFAVGRHFARCTQANSLEMSRQFHSFIHKLYEICWNWLYRWRKHQTFDYTTSSCLTFPLEHALVITVSHYLKHKDAILDTFVSCTLCAVSLYSAWECRCIILCTCML